MKNQYFADKRDFFKWDLLEELSTSRPVRPSLCYVAMLTQPDGTGEGRLTSYAAGGRRSQLHDFLVERRAGDARRVSAMRNYFKERSLEYLPFRDTDGDWFRDDTRTDYFSAIPAKHLEAGVVFLDPDIGLKAGSDSYRARVGADKYVHDEDLELLAARMAEDTVCVLYQHLQRDRNRYWDDIEDRCVRFAKALKVSGASFVSDRDVAFVVSSRQREIRLAAATTLVSYAHRQALETGEILTR